MSATNGFGDPARTINPEVGRVLQRLYDAERRVRELESELTRMGNDNGDQCDQIHALKREVLVLGQINQGLRELLKEGGK